MHLSSKMSPVFVDELNLVAERARLMVRYRAAAPAAQAEASRSYP